MLEKVNDDREKRIKDKNQALMRKIKRLERKKRSIAGGGDNIIIDDYSDGEDLYEEEEQINHRNSMPMMPM